MLRFTFDYKSSPNPCTIYANFVLFECLRMVFFFIGRPPVSVLSNDQRIFNFRVKLQA